MYEQCDIVLIPFPYSDLTGAKKRPALIISNNAFNTTQDRICCLITSATKATPITKKDLAKGTLPFQSWVKPHRIFTVNEKIISKKLATTTRAFHKKILQELGQAIE